MKMARITTIQIRDAGIGFSIGHAVDLVSCGFPNNSRLAATSADIGFHSAITRNTVGSWLMSMKMFEMNVSGNIQMNPAEFATSTDLTLNPIAAEIQLKV